jgi:hypothetical protein
MKRRSHSLLPGKGFVHLGEVALPTSVTARPCAEPAISLAVAQPLPSPTLARSVRPARTIKSSNHLNGPGA